MNRREALKVSAAALAGLSAWPLRGLAASAGEASFYQWREVAPSIFCGQVRTGENVAVLGGNVTLISHPDGSVLVDTMQAVLGRSLRREANVKGAVKHVLNTHHHFDHAGGNAAFTADIPVHGHARCRERLLDDTKTQVAQLDQKIAALEALEIPGAKAAAADARAFKESLAALKADAFAPTKVMENNSVLEAAGRSIVVHHVGAGHTDNDLFLFLPKENVLISGDLVFHRWHPYFDKASGADSKGWQASLRKALEMCNEKTVVIPGHGEVTDRSAIAAQIKYFDDARDAVEKAIGEGKTKEDVAKIELSGYGEYKLKPASGSSLAGIFDELKS